MNILSLSPDTVVKLHWTQKEHWSDSGSGEIRNLAHIIRARLDHDPEMAESIRISGNRRVRLGVSVQDGKPKELSKKDIIALFDRHPQKRTKDSVHRVLNMLEFSK